MTIEKPANEIQWKQRKYYVRKKNDLPVPGSHERGRHGAEICEGGVRHELGGADGAERECV